MIRHERDKRTQVISYLTAKEADIAGLSKYIETYTINKFGLGNCSDEGLENVEGTGTGLNAEYYRELGLKGSPVTRVEPTVNFDWQTNAPLANFPPERFSVRFVGRIKAPKSGTFTFTTYSDDGVRLWLNDSLLINQWNDHSVTAHSSTVNLIEGEFYKIRLEYYDNTADAVIKLNWTYPGQAEQAIPQQFLYPPAKDVFIINDVLTKEKRINKYRKENHIS